MANKIRKLLDNNGDTIAPVTSTKSVICNSGDSADYILAGKVEFKDVPGNPSIPGLPENVVDLSYQDIYGNKKSTRETANSYVINKPGYYKFPLVYGCGIKDGAVNISSYTNLGGQYQAAFVNYLGNQITSPYIEEDTGVFAIKANLEISDTDKIIDKIEIISNTFEDCRFLQFRVLQVPDSGANAIISIKTSDNVIMWSWHLWLWKEDLTPIEIENYSGNSYYALPVNLASKYDEDGIHLKSWFYQWGRKDPMLLPESYNSSKNHKSFGNSVFSIITTPAASVSDAIKNPCTFYTLDTVNWDYNYNWVQLDYFFNYWDATCNSTGANEKTITKTVYDPCPPGYSIPNARVFTGFTESGDWGYYNSPSDNTINEIGNWDSGWNFKATPDGGSVFFPAGGCRGDTSGGLASVGSNGYYWSAGANSSSRAYFLYFFSGSVSPLGSTNRACGFSVRPFLE